MGCYKLLIVAAQLLHASVPNSGCIATKQQLLQHYVRLCFLMSLPRTGDSTHRLRQSKRLLQALFTYSALAIHHSSAFMKTFAFMKTQVFE